MERKENISHNLGRSLDPLHATELRRRKRLLEVYKSTNVMVTMSCNYTTVNSQNRAPEQQRCLLSDYI